MRFTQDFGIDFLEASAGTKAVELRLGILEGLVELGHRPLILNRVPKQHLPLLDGGEKDGYNYSFLENCEYYPDEIPDELDMVIVEGSVDNVQFGEEGISRFAEVLKKFDGRAVVYHHGDQNCSVPIGEIKRAEENGPRENGKSHYWNILAGVPWRPEQWELWTPGNPQRLSSLPSERRGYQYISAGKRRQFKIGFSEQFDRPRNDQISWDPAELIYVGAERSSSRLERLRALYGEGDCCKRLLYGSWSFTPSGWDYRGFVPGFGMVYSLLPQAVSTISVTDSWFNAQEMVTTRIVQGIRAGSLTLADAQMDPWILDYLPSKDFLVSSHEGVHEKLNSFNKIEDKKSFFEWQANKLEPWRDILDRAIKEK